MEHVYRSYYTKSDAIVRYMCRRLDVKAGMRLLEPCAGDGVLVDGLNHNIDDLNIDMYEINPQAITFLQNRYKKCQNIKIVTGDVLDDEQLTLAANLGGVYDRIIANPPYGGWLDYDKRRYLKELYPGLYTKETYTLFLKRCISLLRDTGILVFIIPDTFLNLHMHTTLRDYILKRTQIDEVALFPSSFFPGVNFGYSNLCIVTLRKCFDEKACLDNNMTIIRGFRNVEELGSLDKEKKEYHKTYRFKQDDVYNNLDHALYVSDDPNVSVLINEAETHVADVANVVTGIYSGNDKEYLYVLTHDIRNSKRYKIVNSDLVYRGQLSDKQRMEGIESKKHFVPIVKGGGTKYVKRDVWFLDWSRESVSHYRNDKKARFQNSEYYFQSGIGIPMVSSRQITASITNDRLFDQSIVGVFLTKESLFHYLLAFFNSPTCNTLIRTINPTANNSANYIKKIPIIEPKAADMNVINRKVRGIVSSQELEQKYCREDEEELHRIIKRIYGF